MAKLTAKQQAFIAAYSGNGTEAARLAGYAGSDQVLGQVASENLKKPEIQKAIAARQSKASASLIASREERQTFWTSLMRDTELGLYDRVRASELLGKSQAD